MSDIDDLAYTPQRIQTNDLPQVVEQLQNEFWRISAILEVLRTGYYPKTHVAPDRPRDGMVRYADGTNWNPGSGQGIYIYFDSRWNFMGSGDYFLDIAKGNISGTSYINKFGHQAVIDTADTPVDIWGGGGIHIQPTVAQTHGFFSDSIEDKGTVISSGALTSTTDNETVIDELATFITDGVAVGDAYLNDTAFDHSVVLSVTSETQLSLVGLHDGKANTIGDTYRVVTPNGTGVAVVHVKKALDQNLAELGEFVVMDGSATVSSSNQYLRMDRIHNDLTGSNDSNVGDVSAKALTDNTLTAFVAAGTGQTLMALYTVPKGKTAYITQWTATLGKAGKTAEAQAECSLRVSKFTPVNTVGTIIESVINLGIDGSGSVTREFKPYKRIEELTDIIVRCDEVTDNASHINAEFDVILVDN